MIVLEYCSGYNVANRQGRLAADAVGQMGDISGLPGLVAVEVINRNKLGICSQGRASKCADGLEVGPQRFMISHSHLPEQLEE